MYGRIAAPHAVIVLNPSAELKDPRCAVHGMVVSSSIPRPGPDHIPMPNKRTHNPCTTCFDRPCWAVAPWVLRITDRSKLGAPCGYIGRATLRKVLEAFVRVVQSGAAPIEHPGGEQPLRAR